MSSDLILIGLSLLTWGIGEGMFLYFQPLYLQELGASPIMIGGILSAVGIAMASAHIPAGYLADKIGRRPLLLAAWILGLASAWIMALAQTLPVFVVGSAIYGLTSFVMAPLNSYITAARGNFSVGRALTLVSASYNTGAIIGPLLGGWTGSQAGLKSNFLVAACFFIVSTIIVLFIKSQPVETQTYDQTGSSVKELLNKRYLHFLLVVFIATFSMYLPQPLSPNFLQNERGVNLSQIGILLSLRSAGVVILNLVMGQFDARLGFIIAQAAVGGFAALLWKGTDFYWYAAGYLLLGSYHTARALATAQGRSLVKASSMGLAYGMIETTVASAAILAPILAGILYNQNATWMYIACLALVGFAMVNTLFLKRPEETHSP